MQEEEDFLEGERLKRKGRKRKSMHELHLKA
jgi:hypothetical protein